MGSYDVYLSVRICINNIEADSEKDAICKAESMAYDIDEVEDVVELDYCVEMLKSNFLGGKDGKEI